MIGARYLGGVLSGYQAGIIRVSAHYRAGINQIRGARRNFCALVRSKLRAAITTTMSGFLYPNSNSSATEVITDMIAVSRSREIT
jgi:hypothetical protein